MKNFILILTAIVIAFVLATYILHRIFKGKKSIKYLPSIAAFALGVYCMYIARTTSEGFQGIGYMLLGIMCFTGFLGGIISGIVIDYIKPGIRK